jgi:hypothetical protein
VSYFELSALYYLTHAISVCSKQSGNLEGRALLANICFELGVLCQADLNDLEQAHAFYNEAIQYMPTHKKVLYFNHLIFSEANPDRRW